MKKFKFLEHKADLKIRIYGRDLAELFVNAALSLAEQQNPKIYPSADREWESIEIQSSDLESLLIDWLNEILSQSDLNQKIYNHFKIEEISENQLKAKIAGVKTEQKQTEIKAATYHGLEIKKTNNHWQAIVILDI